MIILYCKILTCLLYTSTVYIAQKIAQLRGMNVRDVIDITRKNAEIMFKI